MHEVAGARGREAVAQPRAPGVDAFPIVVLGVELGDPFELGREFGVVAALNAIIALRCCILSGRFEDFWERRAANAA